MRFDGKWKRCYDGALRPVVYGYVADAAGERHKLPLMVDPGADVTVPSAVALTELGFEPGTTATDGLEGVGGWSDAMVVDSPLWLRTDAGHSIRFNIPLRSSAAVAAFGVSVLGRDVLNNFSVIIDYPAVVVCLLAGNHRYVVQGQ